MTMIITVFGATGIVGNSVAQALLKANPQIQVRAVTRNPYHHKATALAQNGATVITADMNDRESLVPALQGAHGCFVTTNVPFTEPMSEQLERQQGECIADVCFVMKVQHVVLNCQNHVSKVIGVRAGHYDAKAYTNDYMNERETPLTSIILPFAYENFLAGYKPKQLHQHKYSIGLPIGELSLNMISLDQVGQAVHHIFNNRESTLGKTFSLVGDKLTATEIAATLTTHLRPNVVVDAKITLQDFKRINGSSPGSEDVTNMFDFLRKATQRFSIETTRKLIPDLLNFDRWVCQNRQTLLGLLSE